jgi:hypothetical protein
LRVRLRRGEGWVWSGVSILEHLSGGAVCSLYGFGLFWSRYLDGAINLVLWKKEVCHTTAWGSAR